MSPRPPSKRAAPRTRLRWWRPALGVLGLATGVACSEEPVAPPSSSGGGSDLSSGGRAVSSGGSSVTGGASTSSSGGSLFEATGGTSSGGSSAGTGGSSLEAGGAPSEAGGTSGDGGTPAVAPGLSDKREMRVSSQGLTIVSYGGYLNGEAFQQEGILTHAGFQYVAFWNQARHVVLARRELPDGAWDALEFTDYTNSADDAHNTISIGAVSGDGTLHLAFDHHGDDLHYRRSALGLLSAASGVAWSTASFSAVTSVLTGSTPVRLVTYPRFFATPSGDELFLSLRQGESGAGDEVLFAYDASRGLWALRGKYIDGVTADENAYLHGIAFTRDGARLYAAWCSRKTPDATTNHDLYAIWSDDRGRTWKNDAGALVGTSGTEPIGAVDAGVRVWEIGENRGLINQEHMALDAEGGVHVLLAHLPDAAASIANFTEARKKTEYFHYYRPPEGEWARHPLGLPSLENFRGKLAFSRAGNVYAILPNLRVAAAAASDHYSEWSLFDDSDAGRFFSDPLVDTARLLAEDTLSIFAPLKNSGELWVIDWTVR